MQFIFSKYINERAGRGWGGNVIKLRRRPRRVMGNKIITMELTVRFNTRMRSNMEDHNPKRDSIIFLEEDRYVAISVEFLEV